MMYITGIGDEVSNFVIILLIIIIVYFGWRSTNVRENTSPVGVFIIEQNSRTPSAREVQRSDSQLSNHTETEELTVNNVIEELENDISEYISSNSNTISEQATSAESNVNNSEINGEEQIIEAMDRVDAIETEPNKTSGNELRHRKVTENDDLMRKDNDRELTIKLKYLNDELKLVSAKSSEAIGEFKRRNFSVELSAQKLVRLVFNGHVLQPDKKTLEECGLFDQCVVHCLIHNKKPDITNPTSNTDSHQNQNTNSNTGETTTGNRVDASDSFLNRPEHGRWYLYIGMVLITITLIFCWFCRINYSYLFTFYSTIGLVLMSVLFFAMIPLILLIERDVVN